VTRSVREERELNVVCAARIVSLSARVIAQTARWVTVVEVSTGNCPAKFNFIACLSDSHPEFFLGGGGG
jgi:hypothetical protein